MRRRTFLALAGAATLPFAARAQRARKTKRIGFLRVGEPPSSFIEPFRAGLRELGYIEGRDIEIVYGLPKTVEELNDAAAELVRLNVDVLVASGTPSVAPAKKATDVIPVVFIAAIDPVAIKVANSLAQPGGNVTGLTAVFADLTGKRLELMRELVPNLSRVVLLSRTANPGHHQYVREGERAAQQLQIELVTLTVEGANDFEAAFQRARGASAILQIDDALFTSHGSILVALATQHGLPGIYGTREFVTSGGLVALGPSYADLYHRAAGYVDKVFRGESPGDLPIQQPSKFELVINLKTAKALGLTVPATLLARADELIE